MNFIFNKIAPKFTGRLSLFVTGIFAYLPTLFIPVLSSDEAGWGTMSRYIFSGKFYEIVSDNKPPLHFQLHWLVSFGESSILSIKLFVILWACFGGLGIYKIINFFKDSKAAITAAHLFVLYSGVVNYGAYTGERIITPLCIWATALSLPHLSRRVDSFSLRSFLIGILIASAFQIKQTSLFLSIPCLWILILTSRSFYTACSKVFAVGLGAVAITIVSWLSVGVSPALIWREAFAMNFIYIQVPQGWSSAAIKDLLGNILLVVGFEYLPLIIATISALIEGVRKQSGTIFNSLLSPKTLFVVALVSSVAALSVGGRFYQQYFSVLLPLLAIGSALPRLWPSQRSILISGFVIVASLHGFTTIRQLNDTNRNWNSQIVQLLERLRSDTSQNEKIWISNSIYSAYWLSPRDPAVRYLYFLQILGYVDPCRATDDQLIEKRNPNFDMLMKDLEHQQPTVIFWAQHPSNNCSNRILLDNFPTIKSFIATHYTMIYRDSLGIYFKRNSQT